MEPASAGLRYVTGDALDYALLAAAQLDNVAVRVAHEHRNLPALAKTDRSLGDGNAVFVQRGDGFRDRRDAQRDVSVAGVFVPDVIRMLVAGRVASTMPSIRKTTSVLLPIPGSCRTCAIH